MQMTFSGKRQHCTKYQQKVSGNANYERNPIISDIYADSETNTMVE